MTAKWDAALYARNTSHHRAYDHAVLEPIPFDPFWNVLDIGSGSGDLTSRIAERVTNGGVLGIDASEEHVELASSVYAQTSNLRFLAVRAEEVGTIAPLALSNGAIVGPPFDLVISTATLHWVPESAHPGLYRSIFDLLVPGGLFRADFGGKGQIAPVRAVLDEESAARNGTTNPWYFPDPERVASDLAAAGFDLSPRPPRLIEQRRILPDADAFIGWLDSQVFVAYRPGLDEESYEQFRSASITRLLEAAARDPMGFDQLYTRLDLLVRRAP